MSHETSSSVYARAAKCYRPPDKVTVHATNTHRHNRTCLSAKFPVQLCNFSSNLFLLGAWDVETVVKQIMLFPKVQGDRERVF